MRKRDKKNLRLRTSSRRRRPMLRSSRKKKRMPPQFKQLNNKHFSVA